MHEEDANPFASPSEVSAPNLSKKQFDVILWRVRLAWIFPSVAVVLIGIGIVIHALRNEPMHIALMIAILSCMACGVAYSAYSTVMAWSIPEIQGHAAIGTIVNILLVIAVCGGVFS